MADDVTARLKRRARGTKALDATTKAVATSTAALAVLGAPWGTVAASAGAAVAVALKVAGLIRHRGDLVLSGDPKAIAGFLRRSARWNAAKRKRVAVKLHKQFQRLQKRASRRSGRRGKIGDTLAVHIKANKMKISALVALEVESRKDHRTPVVADDAATIPSRVESDPSAGLPDAAEAEFVNIGGVPLSYWIGGAAAVTVLSILLTRSGSGRENR